MNDLSGVGRDRAYREIQEMAALGVVLLAEAPGRGAVYHVAPDLREARAFLQERLRQLRKHFAYKPYLKHADYRGMFGATRVRAVRELGRLVERDYLVAEGRGGGARYRPGRSWGRRRNESGNESP